MSLINEALKKAQRLRSESAAAAASGSSFPREITIELTRVPKRRKPLRIKTIVLTATILGAGTLAGLFVAIVGVTDLFTEPPELVARPPVVAPAELPPELAVEPAPVAAAILEPEPPPAVIEAPPPPEPPPPPAKPQANPHILVFLDSARITGIRPAGEDSRVLMNDRVYRIGSIVDSELGLTLHEVTATSLIFEDSAGFLYEKPF